ncbi:MAG: electron transfer flavoprotein subunit alpha/FixB family protein [Chloroflexota bacterium]|jgi:electron transfer flavoprotein alpha subunit|nr:electron transfer flavoprotein subunit alpha/FixB family protein [Chloroflexota bacterium]
MSGDILVVVEHRDGVILDTTHELLGGAAKLAAAGGGDVVAVLLGSGLAGLAGSLDGASRAIIVDDPGLDAFSPSSYLAALVPLVRERAPDLVLVANSGPGMDVAAGLSAALDLPLAAYVTDITLDGGSPLVTCQLYAGKIQAAVRFEGGRGIATVVAGSFAPTAAGVSPTTETVPAASTDARIRFRGLHRPEAGDVDITREAVLVSVGRGIGEQDNIELVEALAAAVGGAVSSSRPIADSGWLPRTRQVGKSGLKVKPKVYLALGISGAPEHLEGMRGAELIIAVNTDPRAPIFSVAHYGAVADLLDVVPALTARLGG